MHRVLVCDPIAKEGIALLEKDANVSCEVKLRQSPESVKACVKDVHAMIVRSETKVTKEIIDAASSLKVIGRAGTGLDNIDVEAAKARGIQVVNVPDATTVAVAELTMAMLLLLARPVVAAHESLSQKRWERAKFLGSELWKKTLGIVGLGKIGLAVADRALSFGMRVIGQSLPIDMENASAHHVEWVGWPRVLQEADFLSFHVPLMKETRGMIGEKEFAMMKRGVKLVNCARGGIIDEAALVHALKNQHVAAIALDVYETEPPLNSELLAMDTGGHVIHTPHIGALTSEAQTRAGVEIAKKVLSILGS